MTLVHLIIASLTQQTATVTFVLAHNTATLHVEMENHKYCTYLILTGKHCANIDSVSKSVLHDSDKLHETFWGKTTALWNIRLLLFHITIIRYFFIYSLSDFKYDYIIHLTTYNVWYISRQIDKKLHYSIHTTD